MMPMHDLLARMRCDPAFGFGRFTIRYYDRLAAEDVRIPLARVQLRGDDASALTAIAPDGSAHRVPLHRLREVWRGGELLWRHDRARPRSHSG